MSATLQTFRQAYENAQTPREQAVALLEICDVYQHINPRQLLEYAKEAEALARKARFRRGIAAALKYLGMGRIHLGGNQDGLETIRRSYEIYAKLNDHSGMIHTLCTLAIGDTFNGAPDKARTLLLEAEQLLDTSTPSKELVRLLIAWGGLHILLGEPEQFLDSTRRLLATAEAIDDRPGMIIAYRNLGSISRWYKDSPTALEHFNRALQISHENGYTKLELDVLQDIAMQQQYAQNLDEALKVGLQAKAIARELKAEHGVILTERILCGIYQARNEFDSALNCAERMTRLARRHSPPLMAADIYRTRAELHLAYSQLEEAVVWYEHSLEATRQSGSTPYTMYAHQALAELFERKGDVVTAYKHYRAYMEIQEELQGYMKQKAIASASVAAQMEHGERERQRLQETTRRLELEIERKQQELASTSLLVAERDDMFAELRTELRTTLSLAPEESQRRISSVISRLGKDLNPTQAWEEFNRQLQIADPEFIRKITEQFGHLTPNELKICSLLRFNLSTKDIASLLSVQPSSVDMYRSAIRRKLGLPKATNLTTFLGGI